MRYKIDFGIVISRCIGKMGLRGKNRVFRFSQFGMGGYLLLGRI